MWVSVSGIIKIEENARRTDRGINEKIALAKQEEQILVQKLNAANADQGAAKTMIYDYKNRYVVQYIANVTLFFGTIITATILVKTYRIKSSQ